MKLIIIIMTLAASLLTNAKSHQPTLELNSTMVFTESKDLAFQVLDTKCNVCHQIKNKRRVFTKENMDDNGKRIYKQVFVWKRMPKGNEITLTNTEYDQLKSWLSSINIK